MKPEYQPLSDIEYLESLPDDPSSPNAPGAKKSQSRSSKPPMPRLKQYKIIYSVGLETDVTEVDSFREEVFKAMTEIGGSALSVSRVMIQASETGNIYCLSDITSVIMLH